MTGLRNDVKAADRNNPKENTLTEPVTASTYGTIKKTLLGQEWCVCPSDRVTGDMIRVGALGSESIVLCQAILNEGTGEIERKPILRNDLHRVNMGPLKV